MSTTYFVSYTFSQDCKSGHGMLEITTERGINDFDDVIAVMNKIKELTKSDTVVLVNWKEIDARPAPQEINQGESNGSP